jgi:two-component system, cell cycle sensor histidine kinase and response regulator CckA
VSESAISTPVSLTKALYSFVKVEPELERLLREPTDLGTAIEMPSRSEQMHTFELDIARRLQLVATQMINVHGTEALYEQILDTAMAVLHCDFASIQMFYPERGAHGELKLIGHRGFSREAVERWGWVRPDMCTTCGEALRTGRRVAIPDVRNCEFMAGSDDLAGYLGGGIRAVQSTPLVSRSGSLMGMVSTHWRDVHELSAVELSALDVLARMAADLIERSRAEEKVRESEERLRFAQETADIGTFDLDLDSGVLTWTPQFERLYGLPPDRPFRGTREDWHALLHPDDRDRADRRRVESFETDAPVEEEWRVIWPDGSIHWLAGRWKVIRNAEGKPVRMMGVNIDITRRKQMEQALHDSERRFRNIADTAPVMIWMSGPDKLCTFVNQPWLAFTGATIEQGLGNGWLSSVHPEDQGRCLADYSSSFDARHSFQLEYRMRRADGEYRWVLNNGTPRYRETEFAGYIGSCIDITEQKRVEAQLRSNHAQLVDSQRLASVGSWELDIATRTTRWSDEWYRIFGLPRDARPEFQTFLNCVEPRDREIVLQAEKKAQASDAPFGEEFRIVRPDGEVRFIRSIVEAIKNDEGALVRLIGAAQDVTEQVRATELLRESESRLKAAERLTHVGHWTWNLKTNRATWSEEIFRIMGQPQDYEPDYEVFLQMVLSADRDRLEKWITNCLSAREGSLIEYRVFRPSGEVRTVVCKSEVLLGEGGAPEVFFGTLQDVTDDRRAQEESFARQKLESLGSLASGIAHDFNNLLGAVLAQTELAMTELATGSDPHEELGAIRDVAIRGSEIVRQLMIYAGKENDGIGTVDVSRVVEGMQGLLKIAVSRHAALITDLGEALPVRARPAQISQIVMNLVVNASEALGDHDGVVRVTTKHISVGPAEAIAKALQAGEYVSLQVSDTGCGMPLEMQARLFDPFFTTKFSGRGLGLAVVHGIVRSLRGAIQVASQPGEGTTFDILLPCAEAGYDSDAGRILPVEDFAPPAPRAALLIVDDEEQLRSGVAKMLRKSGLEVFEAASGSAAIELLRARDGEIDLILLDLTIPGSSSHEVVAEAALVRPDVKVILTSAYAEEVAMQMTNHPLVCGFIRKPFRHGDLVQSLRSALFHS